MGLGRRWAAVRVRRNSFRHGSGQTMGSRKSSPKFISARVWTGDGQAQEFAEIHFGMGLGRRWETEMNFGQRAGRRGRRRRWATEMNFAQLAGRRGLDRRWATEMNFAQLAGRRGLGRRWATEMNVGQPAGRRGLDRRWATEMNFAQLAGRRGLGRRWAGARVRRNSFRHGSGQTMGSRKSSPKFISAWVWTGDGRPK
jgi:ribosomal protein L20A (L18A)